VLAVLAGILVLGVGVYWGLLARSDRRSQGVVRSKEPIAQDPSAPAPALQERVEAEQNAALQEPTVEEVLADYWGADWPRIQAALVKEGKDLSAPFHMVSWEEQSEVIYEMMFHLSEEDLAEWRSNLLRWPEELTSEWLVGRELLPSGTELSPDQLGEISDLAATWNDDIRWKAEDYLILLSAELQRRWDTGDFQRAPYSTYGIPDVPDAFYSSAAATSCWNARVSLSRSQHPDMHAINNEVGELARQRDKAIRSLIKDQRAR
jgi:hypothetical protein